MRSSNDVTVADVNSTLAELNDLVLKYSECSLANDAVSSQAIHCERSYNKEFERNNKFLNRIVGHFWLYKLQYSETNECLNKAERLAEYAKTVCRR